MSPRAARHVAAAIIRRRDEIVLVLQGARGEEPFWGLPGGVVEDDELVPEGLAREVREETGLEIRGLRLAYLRQIDNRRSEQLQEGRGRHGVGYLVTVWVFEADSWEGELEACDPDGVVSDARFVSVGDAVQRLRRTRWLELAADYLEGRIVPGSFHFERWHEDGRIDTVALIRSPTA
jgi:ADP-ribose pyrophosphatase YjhB (NUDIX family)